MMGLAIESGKEVINHNSMHTKGKNSIRDSYASNNYSSQQGPRRSADRMDIEPKRPNQSSRSIRLCQ